MELFEQDLTDKILGCCFEVSNELGFGFLEAVYENALLISLRSLGLSVEQQVPLEVFFRGQPVGLYVADLIVERRVLLELKAVSRLLSEHEAQTINYLRATGMRIGMLINFGKARVEWKRLVS